MGKANKNQKARKKYKTKKKHLASLAKILVKSFNQKKS